MKNIIIEIKNTKDKFNRRSDATKERITKLENISQKNVIRMQCRNKETENMKKIFNRWRIKL